MVKETRFYELLGIPPDDGNNRIEGDDLKKAYRKAALRAHPDKGGSDEQFKLVTEAYNILNDPAKREVYNSRGEKGVQEMNERGPEMDPQDLFSQLFGGGGGFFGGPGGQRAGPRKSKDLVHRVHVTLEDLYKGKTTKLALSRHVTCTKCNGKGGKEGAVKSCQSCSGRGSKFILRQIGPMLQQIQQTCNDCDGAGETINAKDRCKICNGKKIVAEKKVLDVHIDKGMKGGQTVTFQGQSDYGPDTLPGDVVIVVEEKPHERFKREGNDLWHETEIDLLTALGGGQFSIKHLDERVLIVKIEPGEVIKPGALKVISGQGMPSLRHHELGDLYIRLNIEFPETIDGDMLHHLEAALPPRKPIQPPPPGHDIEEVEMTDLDARQQRAAQREGDEMDEDDEGPARMQCSNQ